MPDQLQKGEIGLKLGNSFIPKSAVSVAVKILTESEGTTIKNAKIQVEYEIDPIYYVSPDKENDPPISGGYKINFDEIGLETDKSIVDQERLDKSDTYINITDRGAYMYLKIPIEYTKKRDSGN